MTTLQTLLKNRQMKLIDLARALRVNKGTVSRWAQKGVPADRVADVADKTGISPHDIRPDLASVFSKPKGHAA